jgi:hypothetical protein
LADGRFRIINHTIAVIIEQGQHVAHAVPADAIVTVPSKTQLSKLLKTHSLNKSPAERIGYAPSRCRVGGGALARWPPSAAQTVRADFRHTAFTKTPSGEGGMRLFRCIAHVFRCGHAARVISDCGHSGASLPFWIRISGQDEMLELIPKAVEFLFWGFGLHARI